MVKALLCLAAATAVAVALLQLRQQRLNLSYQANQLHNEIQVEQSRLWDQQLQIAIATAPNAMQEAIQQQDVHYVAPADPPDHLTSWADPQRKPDAPPPGQ